MKKCCALAEAGVPDQATEHKFRTKFTEHMEDTTATNYRGLFGLPEDDGVDSFAAIAIDAEA